MKKFEKNLIKLGLFFTGQIVTNKLIFNNTDLSKVDDYDENLYFNHKFGKIKYNVIGKENLTPLVLIHGLCAGASSREWEKIVTPLSSKYRVYTFDLLGFGASDRPNISYNAYLYVDIINSFIENIVKKSCHVIGSNTSADFLIMASKIKPSNYDKVILVNPSGLVKPNLFHSFSDKLIKTTLQLPVIGTSFYNMICSRISMKYFLKKYIFTNPKLVTNEEVNKYYYASHYGGEKNQVPIAYFASGFLGVDSGKALLDTKTDTLVIFGEDNKFLPVYESRDFAKGNSNITTIIFPFTKALPHVERYSLFIKKIYEFLGTVN